jgi:hypothetical protein
MRSKAILALAVASLAIPLAASNVIPPRSRARAAAIRAPRTAGDAGQARLHADVAAVQPFRRRIGAARTRLASMIT